MSSVFVRLGVLGADDFRCADAVETLAEEPRRFLVPAASSAPGFEAYANLTVQGGVKDMIQPIIKDDRRDLGWPLSQGRQASPTGRAVPALKPRNPL